ncbi:MAG: hypothetical protein ABFR33_09340 [Verrucomicrobiota bacterium]
MNHLLDMVHHNPGEAPFETVFSDPSVLRGCGYTGQVLKHINTSVSFAAAGDFFPAGSEARRWLDATSERIDGEIRAAKSAGLAVFYHLDLILLPQKLVEAYRDEICDADGRISLDRPKTLEIHRMLFDELFERFPQVDGFVIRIGETYLHDTPYHTGNGAVACHTFGLTDEEKAGFVKLIDFLREEVCVRHGRKVFFRTWDCFPDRFHANLDNYLEITDRIEPHENLLFSIKHTQLDFWHWTEFNPCLTQGRHRQIVEVQCQREYEGKGAWPNYVMKQVIDGYPENDPVRGLRDIAGHPLIDGIWTWSRGGGWYGPYLQSEFWPELNVRVLARWAQDPTRSEEEVFLETCREDFGFSAEAAVQFRELALIAAEATFKGRYCAAFDRNRSAVPWSSRWPLEPTCNWMRDDCLCGLHRLQAVFDRLVAIGAVDEALEEKREAVVLWERVAGLGRTMDWPNPELKQKVASSIEYGLRLFRMAECGWRALLGNDPEAAEEYRCAKADYEKVADLPYAATLFESKEWSLPGEPVPSGLDESVRQGVFRFQIDN